MANSDAEGIIKFPAGAYGDDQPVEALSSRLLMNNAEHFADMDGQARVCASGFELATRPPDNSTRWLPIVVAGPYPLRIDNSGVPYKIRCRMAGLAGSQVNQVRLRACVSSMNRMQSEMLRAGTNVLEVTTSSTTGAWLTATTGASGTTILSFSNEQTIDAFRPSFDTIDGIAGDPIAIETYHWVCSVWGQTTNTATTPTLTGLYLAEYIGT